MNLLFSSDARPRYISDIVDAMCYPCGHIVRLRYQDKYVSPGVRNWRVKASGLVRVPYCDKDAVVIFADTSNTPTSHMFMFFPVRFGRIVALWKRASIYYVDVKLCGFVDYHPATGTDGKGTFEAIQDEIGQIYGSPFPRVLSNNDKLLEFKGWSRERKVVDCSAQTVGVGPGYLFLNTQDKIPSLVGSNTTAHPKLKPLAPVSR